MTMHEKRGKALHQPARPQTTHPLPPGETAPGPAPRQAVQAAIEAFLHQLGCCAQCGQAAARFQCWHAAGMFVLVAWYGQHGAP
jgi:hypothetical protein